MVITDTGVGTTVSNPGNTPAVWTIVSFLEHTINPGNRIPYLIVCSHCHWDHILGLKHFLPSEQPGWSGHQAGTDVTVVASGRETEFLQPWETLNFHSLCSANDLPAPCYKVGIWVGDGEKLVYKHRDCVEIDLGIVAIHTPGHTPDSLTWYDVSERVVYVGDSLYERESFETREAPWGKEEPGPIMFTLEGSVADWWASIHKLITFVEQENDRGQKAGKPRLKLAAGHVTADADAHDTLVGARDFMARVLRGQVRHYHMDEARGKPMGHWTDDSPERPGEVVGKFSVGAPLDVIEKGKKTTGPSLM